MPDPRRTTLIRLTFAACAVAIFATVAEVASSSAVRKSAVVLCFVTLAVAYFLPGKPSSAAGDSNFDDDSNDRQSLLARLAWAAWMSIAAAACFAISQLAEALTPALQLPFRVLGSGLLIVAAYKLFFGRRGKNTDIDL